MTVRRGLGDERKRIPNLFSDKPLWRLTDSAESSMNSYYDLTPFSPDGRKIVFCSYNHERNYMSLYWMDAEAGPPQWVCTTRFHDSHMGLMQQWLPKGNRIAFRDSDDRGDFLHIVDIDSGQHTRIDGDLRMLHPLGGRAVSCTPPDPLIAIGERREAGVFLTDLYDGGRTLLATMQAMVEIHPERARIEPLRRLHLKHPKWSPDGERISVVLTNEGSTVDGGQYVKSIYAMDEDGGNLRYVCSFPGWNHPSWHPDGRRIVLNRLNERNEKRLTLVDADTGRIEDVTDRIEGRGHPSFSPDGKYVVHDRYTLTWGQSGLCELFLLDVERDAVERINAFTILDHSYKGNHIHPVWSRDGTSIVFNSDQTGHSELYRIFI